MNRNFARTLLPFILFALNLPLLAYGECIPKYSWKECEDIAPIFCEDYTGCRLIVIDNTGGFPSKIRKCEGTRVACSTWADQRTCLQHECNWLSERINPTPPPFTIIHGKHPTGVETIWHEHDPNNPPTPNTCLKYCKQNPNCTVFVYSNRYKGCYLKGGFITGWRDWPEGFSGVKND